MIRVDSLNDPRLEPYINRTEVQLRNRLEPDEGMFIVESPKVIDRALAAHHEPVSFLVEDGWLESMESAFNLVDSQWGENIPIYVASRSLLKELTGYRLHQGAMCAMKRWKLPSVAEICKDAKRVAVMENIVDFNNVGALMRSAAALGIDAVLATPSCLDPLYRRAIRVSMGTVFQVPWTRIGGDERKNWPNPSINELKDLGFTTVSMALTDDSISMMELSSRIHSPEGSDGHIDKVALIFGTEGTGLNQQTIAATDLTVKIPMSHGVDSLNVAASSAVAFYATL